MGAAALVHRRVGLPEDFDAGRDAWINTLVSDTGDEAPGMALPEGLEPELHPRSDRVISTRIQRFSSVVYRFSYEASRLKGYVEVAGSPPSVSASSNWKPLRIRKTLTAVTAAIFGITGLGLAGAYSQRHAWYSDFGHEGLVAILCSLLALSLAIVVAGLLLPRRFWSHARVWTPLALAGVAAISVGIAWKVPGPSAAAARKALADKDFRRAEIEAKALRELNIDEMTGAEILDDLHIERVTSARTFDELASVVAEPWNFRGARQRALDLLRTSAERERGNLYGLKDIEGIVALSKSVGDFDPLLRDNLAAHAMLLRADQCVQTKDCSCTANGLKAAAAIEALAREVTRIHDRAIPAFAIALKELVHTAAPAPGRDAYQRQKEFRQALQLAKCYEDLAGVPSNPSLSVLETQLALVDREVNAADKKAAALAAAEEAKRKRAEIIEEAKQKQLKAAASAKAAAEERVERAANRNLICRDGSISGCACAGSHRGCCSHHGGVAGCEPL